jgi:MFS family permease
VLIPAFVQAPAGSGYGFDASPTVAGLFLLPATIAITIVGQLAGTLERRIGSRGALIGGAAFALAAYALLVVDRSSEADIYVAAALLGIGIGLSFSAMANLIVENVRQEQTGVATGMNAVTRTLGGAFGGQVAATLLAGNLAASGLPTNHGFSLAFGMCLIALVAALGFSIAVPRRGRTQEQLSPAAAYPRPKTRDLERAAA